jgi:tetratricopeptide (TPR) repeat protein
MDILELGDVEAVRRELQAYTNLAEELQQPFYLWNVTILRTTWALLTGRFGEAEQLIQEGLALGQRTQTPNAFLIFGIQLFGLRREQGRLQEIEDAVKGFVDRYPAIPAWRTVLAFLYGELNRAAEAQNEFERLAVNKFADLPRDQQWLPGMALLAQTAAFLHDTQRAQMVYELLVLYADRVAVVGSANDCYGSVSRYLGILASTMSRWDDAVGHFTAALATNTQMGARPFVAHTQYEYARTLLTRNQPGDVAQARVLLDEALATAQELRMKGLEEKIKLSVASYPSLVKSQPDARDWRLEASSPSSQAPSLKPLASIFHQEGDYWTIGYNGTVVRLKEMKGLQHLACLLREPGREFHALALIAMTDALPPSSSTPSLRALVDDSLTFSGMGHHARERDAETEKARKAVAHRIRTVLTKLQRIHPVLWRHLFASLKTGTFCSYNPPQPITWQV